MDCQMKNSLAAFMIFILLFFALSNSVNAQHPNKISLNGNWAFRIDPNNIGEIQNWHKPETNIANWDELPVPGNWDLRNEYAHYVGKGWYRYSFSALPEWKNKIARLCFEAVYHESKVWLNGELLGPNSMGYLPFEFDISTKINRDSPNTVVVCTDNTFKRGAIWSWGGIRRPVTLQIDGPVRVVYQHITPSVDLSKGTSKVAVKVVLQNHTNEIKTEEGSITLSAKDFFNRVLPFKITLLANSTQSVMVQTELSKKETHLWHFDDPFLYESMVKINNDASISNRFGIRKIEIDNINYIFKLNGESIRPMGFNLVPDDRTTGNTLPTWRIKEDIDLLKGVGCTMTRLSHLILPEEVMDYLDERGMLVVSEIPLWGYDPLANPDHPTPKNWLHRMILNQYNHPSVIAWSVGNEIGDYPTTMKYVESSIAYVRTQDSTRLATAVSHTANRSPDFIQFTDIGLINKYSKNLSPVTDLQHRLHPNKVLFYSEYGIGQLRENLDATFDVKSCLDSIRNRPYLIGASLWTFNDYRSSFYGTKEYSENRPWGVVDAFRRKKQVYFSFRKEYSPFREFKVVVKTPTTATLTIVPRNKLDLPAFPLHNYRFVWKLVKEDGKIQQGGFQKLPDIHPAQASFQRTINWTEKDAFSLKVELLTPQLDAVYDTVIFFRKPLPVIISQATGTRTNQNDNRPNSGVIRIFFEKNPTATAYKARYGKDGLTQETPSTIENFIDITPLALQQKYQVVVAAMNGAGETLSEVKTVLVDEKDFAPPIIRHIVPANGGFFVGYATEDDDCLFRAQVSTQSGQYTHAPITQSTTPGVMFVPNLKNGQKYYFKLQRFKDNNAESLWSDERMITPDGGERPAVPAILGVIRQGSEAIVSFQPVSKSTGYELQFRNENQKAEWQTIMISTAVVENYLVKGLNAKQEYEFRLAAINANGKSLYSINRKPE
jgi:beta-galactosidase